MAQFLNSVFRAVGGARRLLLGGAGTLALCASVIMSAPAKADASSLYSQLDFSNIETYSQINDVSIPSMQMQVINDNQNGMVGNVESITFYSTSDDWVDAFNNGGSGFLVNVQYCSVPWSFDSPGISCSGSAGTPSNSLGGPSYGASISNSGNYWTVDLPSGGFSLDPTKYYAIGVLPNWYIGGGDYQTYDYTLGGISTGTCYNYWYDYQTGVTTDCLGGMTQIMYSLNGSGGFVPPPDDEATRIIEIVPASGSVVSTSSPVTVGFTVYINPEDVGIDIRYSLFDLNDKGALFGFTPNNFTWRVQATTSGEVTWSTTTPVALPEGTYNSVVDFEDGCLPFSLFGKRCYSFLLDPNGSIVSSSTMWASGANSAFGQNVANVIDRLDFIFSDNTSTTTSWSAQYCFGSSFDMQGCVMGLLVPSKADLSAVLANAQAGFFSAPPFGYFTRFFSLVTLSSSTPSVMPPELSYTFGSSSPDVLQGGTWSIQIFDHFDKVALIKSDQVGGKGLWEVVDPYFDVVVAFAVLAAMLTTLVGFEFRGDGSDRPSSNADVLTRAEKRRIERSYSKTIGNYDMTERDWNNQKRNNLL